MTTTPATGPMTRRETRKLEFDYIIKEICDLEDTSPFVLFLAEAGIDNTGDLLAISDHEIEEGFEYTDPQDANRKLKMPNGLKKIPRILRAFFAAQCEDAGEPLNWLEMKPEDYDNFRVTAYNPDEVIYAFRKLNIGSKNTSPNC